VDAGVKFPLRSGLKFPKQSGKDFALLGFGTSLPARSKKEDEVFADSSRKRVSNRPIYPIFIPPLTLPLPAPCYRGYPLSRTIWRVEALLFFNYFAFFTAFGDCKGSFSTYLACKAILLFPFFAAIFYKISEFLKELQISYVSIIKPESVRDFYQKCGWDRHDGETESANHHYVTPSFHPRCHN
jgi:hypothetical protein